MSISFVIPYVPIPRIEKRINIAKKIDDVDLIYWDRGTESNENMFEDFDVRSKKVHIPANDGSPFKRLKQTLQFSKEVYKHLNEKKPDIIHVTKTDMLFIIYIYCLFLKNKPKIVYEVSDIHEYALSDKSNMKAKLIARILYIIEKICFSIVDKLIVTSPYFWENYYNKLISDNDTVYLANTPNEEVFRNYNFKKTGKLTIAFIGKIRYVNQIKMLIDAAKVIDIEILIAGNGIGYEEVKKYSMNKSYVKIMGAYNYKNDIAKLYSLTDVVYSVYDTDIKNVRIALPNRLYEAAYCELPLLVSKGTYLEEIVLNGGIGLSVDPFDVDDLIKKIVKLKDEKKINKIKKNGKEFYKKNNATVNNKKLSDLYLNINN